MAGELSAVRAHPAVIVSVVIAAFAVAACALVAMAYMLGWVPLNAAPGPASMASPGQQVAGTAPGVALLPGETLIDNPEVAKAPPPEASPEPIPATGSPGKKPVPSTPSYAPKTSPAASPPQVPRAQPATPTIARSLPSRAAPGAPTYLREVPPEAPRSYERSIRGVCVNCGTIASIGSYGNDWEVRVRFEDGSSQTIRYPERPALRTGERVHLEDGRLLPD
jgi:hypothetical protein